MKTLLIRIFALLGFFLTASTAFAAPYQSSDCQSLANDFCVSYLSDKGGGFQGAYTYFGGTTSITCVGTGGGFGASWPGCIAVTPTPTPTPSPTPTPPSCESGQNAAANVILEGWQDPSLYPWVCSNGCKAESHADGKSYISCLGLSGCSPSNNSNLWGYNHYQLNGETCTETPKYPPTPSPVPTAPSPTATPFPTATPTPITSCPSGQMLVIRTNGNRECIPAVATPIPGTTPTADPAPNPNVTPLPTGTQGGGGSGSGGGGGGGTGGGSGSGGGGGGGTGGGTGSGNGEGQGISCTDINTCDDSDGGAALPGRPQLYQSKYPDGLSGVWTSKMTELKQTPLATLGSRLLPDIGEGGQNPSFTFDLDFGGVMNMGTHTLEIDPNIWAIIRAIVLVSALIYAYKMIFGG